MSDNNDNDHVIDYDALNKIDAIEGNKLNKFPTWLLWTGIFLLLLIVILSIIYWTLPPDKTPRLTSYLGTIAFVGTAIGVITFTLTQYSQARANREAQLQTALNFIQSNFLQLERELATDPDLYQMFRNLNRGNPLTDRVPSDKLAPKDQNVADIKRARMVSLIIQVIESTNSFVITRGLKWSDPQPQLFLQLFRHWFRNEPLLEIGWRNYYEQFSDQTTRDLINFYIIGK